MDNKEEQAGEIEALLSIYPNEITMESEDPYKFTISLGKPADDEDTPSSDESPFYLQIKFTLPGEYPQVEPILELDENETNLEEDQLEELKAHLTEQATENLGMVMVFTIVSAALEWMNNIWEKGIKEEKEREEESERQRIEKEIAEQNHFEGTRVTVVTFMQWKTKFESEVNSKRKELDSLLPDEKGKKLTGKELFLRDKNLYASDILQEDEKEFGEDDFIDDVPIDESLFEDIDDLELDDDE